MAGKLMTVREWRERYFSESSAPSELTVRRWLQSGEVPGRKIGGNWYVDDAAWLAGGDELVARVLAG